MVLGEVGNARITNAFLDVILVNTFGLVIDIQEVVSSSIQNVLRAIDPFPIWPLNRKDTVSAVVLCLHSS